MKVSRMEEQILVSFTSNTEAKFSILVCNITEQSSCDSAGIPQSIPLVRAIFVSHTNLKNTSFENIIFFTVQVTVENHVDFITLSYHLRFLSNFLHIIFNY